MSSKVKYRLDKFHSKIKGIAMVGPNHVKIDFSKISEKDYQLLLSLGFASLVKPKKT